MGLFSILIQFSFQKGYASTVCREIPFSFIEFPLWEWLKRRWCFHSGRLVILIKLIYFIFNFLKDCSAIESATCGSLAGLVAAAITTYLILINLFIPL
jgi:solute carrier family 25 (mitochondrial S-adenosylmethionine transporter), member 26